MLLALVVLCWCLVALMAVAGRWMWEQREAAHERERAGLAEQVDEWRTRARQLEIALDQLRSRELDVVVPERSFVREGPAPTLGELPPEIETFIGGFADAEDAEEFRAAARELAAAGRNAPDILRELQG